MLLTISLVENGSLEILWFSGGRSHGAVGQGGPLTPAEHVVLAWRNVQYAAGIGAECLLRMLQRPACLVVGYDDSLPVGAAVAVSSANGSAVGCRSSSIRFSIAAASTALSSSRAAGPPAIAAKG